MPTRTFATAIVADGTDGWIGLINARGPSITDNREIGVGFTVWQNIFDAAIPSVQITSATDNLVTAFATDFASGVDGNLNQARTITPVTLNPASPSPTVSDFNSQGVCIPASAVPARGLPEMTGARWYRCSRPSRPAKPERHQVPEARSREPTAFRP